MGLKERMFLKHNMVNFSSSREKIRDKLRKVAPQKGCSVNKVIKYVIDVGVAKRICLE